MKNNKETVPANESGYTEVINREDITYVDLTLDRAFKKVYGTRGNEDILLMLLKLPKLKTDRSLLAENEKILYLIHNSGKMKSRPIEFQSPKFDKLFQLITFAGMNREDQMEYLAELDKRLIRNSELQAAMENGEALGFVNGERSKARQTASIMKSKGLDFKLIVECTGLSIEDIEKL